MLEHSNCTGQIPHVFPIQIHIFIFNLFFIEMFDGDETCDDLLLPIQFTSRGNVLNYNFHITSSMFIANFNRTIVIVEKDVGFEDLERFHHLSFYCVKHNLVQGKLRRVNVLVILFLLFFVVIVFVDLCSFNIDPFLVSNINLLS